MLTDDQDDNSSLFVDLLLLLEIKIYPRKNAIEKSQEFMAPNSKS